jgi:hypothetical protein
MALLAVVLGVLIPAVMFVPGYLAGTHTRYCPFSHRISDTAACAVLDSRGGRVLIQHADLDTNENYLELRDEGGSRLYQLPVAVTALAPVGYSAQLIPGGGSLVLIDGERVQLVPLEFSVDLD